MASSSSQERGSVLPITPFRFQSVAVDVCEEAVGKRENLLLVSPTGTGKSVMIAMLFQRVMYLLGLRTVVVTSRDEIRSGILKCMVRVGVPLREAKLRVLTPQQFNNRLSRGLRGGGGGMTLPDLLIFDESHHLLAPTWKHPISLGDMQHIGFTATPIRGDESETPELRAMFQRSYEAITIVQSIIDGYLVPPYIDRTAAGFLVVKPGESDRQQLALMEAQMMARIGEVYDLVEERERCRERRTLFAASSLPEAQAIVQYWRTKGRRVEYIDGRQRSRNLRREILRRFDAGEAWLVGVDIITEGIDLPSASRLVISRRSTALTPYAQLLGRGIRPWRDETDTARLDWKPDCEVLDLTDNFPRFRRMLETHFGLRFRAYPKVWAPDLEYDGRRAALAVSDEQHTTYDYRPVARRASPPQGLYAGRVVTGVVGAANNTDNWAVEMDLGDGVSRVWMLAGGRWVSKRVLVQPVEYEVLIGGRRDLALRMAARLAGGVGVSPARMVFLGDLLLWSVIHAEIAKDKIASGASEESCAIPSEVSRFLGSLTSPAGVARRAGADSLRVGD